jgi:hypothetical protein
MTDSFSTDALDEQEIRRHVHRRLELLREAGTYVAIVGFLAIIGWATGGGWRVQWLALI